MGWPVAHSRSPMVHGYWLAHYGIDGAYVPMAVPPERLAEALKALQVLGFRGCNLTIPHKEAALTLVDWAEEAARRIGAINTVLVLPDGSLEGRNTDALGFWRHLRQSHPGFQPEAGPAVVLGAGGAARAVLAALIGAKVPEIRLLNRHRQRAEYLAQILGTGPSPIFVVDWDRRNAALEGVNFLVNTTTLGMQGNPALDIDLRALPKTATVYDIVYVPLETPLLRQARQRGNPAIDGLGMLLHQACPGFAAWFGVEPEVTAELRAMVEDSLTQTP